MSSDGKLCGDVILSSGSGTDILACDFVMFDNIHIEHVCPCRLLWHKMPGSSASYNSNSHWRWKNSLCCTWLELVYDFYASHAKHSCACTEISGLSCKL